MAANLNLTWFPENPTTTDISGIVKLESSQYGAHVEIPEVAVENVEVYFKQVKGRMRLHIKCDWPLNVPPLSQKGGR